MVTYSRKHCDAKISDIEAKCFTTSDINKFKNEKYKRSQLINLIFGGVKILNSDLEKKIATLATKAELKAEQDKTVKLQALFPTCFQNDNT